MEAEKRSFMDRFTEVAAKLGNQIHLKTLRDAFATIMPLYILAGLAVLFSKYKPSRDIVKMAAVPSIFNINEPMIFGYPIVFNYALLVPFITVPALGIIIAYVATSLGLMSPCVVQIPWTTPPLLSGFLATGGDWRAIIVQALIIVLGVAIYLPFMKVSEKVQMKMMEAENEAE